MRKTPAITFVAILSIATAVSGQIAADEDDILDGQRYLVRADDLVLADPGFISGTTDKTDVQYFILNTDDMMITSSGTSSAKRLTQVDCTSSSPSNHPFPQQTVVVRMFDTPDDYIVTFAPTKGATGSGCGNQSAGQMTFYSEAGISGTVHESVASGDIRNRWLHMVPADFNGDGFDDLFITTDEWIYVATAVDTSSPSSGIHIVASHNLGSSATAMNDPTIGDFNADGNLDVAWMGTGFSSGNTPSVKFATICTGPVENTICASASSFAIMISSETISPDPSDGSIVTVGGKCTENSNNQIGNELRAPPMAVAAGQFDDTVGDELAVVYLYEHDSSNNCHVMAEVYSFTQFSSSSGAGKELTATFQHNADNIATHDHISNPAAIYAQAGNLDWSSSRQHVPVVISGGTDHTVLVISFDDTLMMTLQRHEFSTDHDKSFAGLAIGRFSSAPAADTSTSCSEDTDCPDTCKNDVCEISGFQCSANGDCQGTCTTDGVCSYIKPNNYNLQFAAFLMAHSSDHTSDVYVYTADPVDAFAPKQIQQLTITNFIQTATTRGVRAGSLLRPGDLQGRSQRLGTPTVVRVSKNTQPDLIVSVPPMHADWLPFGELGETQFCDPTPSDCPASFSSDNICNCTDLVSNSTCTDGSELRCLINFSALSGNYVSKYGFSETDSKQSSTTDTTSYSLGLSVDLSEKTKFLSPTGIEITQEVSFASANTYDHSVSKTNTSYKTESFDASTTTGFYDHVWYTQRNYDVYYYPVIGQTVCVDSCQTNGVCSISGAACSDDSDCPNDFTTCPDADKQQLYVQYSGASSVVTGDGDGGSIEWYQPVHEPGQVLSYPWDCQQLASRNDVSICDDSADDYSLLSEEGAFSTDTSTQTFTLNWDVGTGSSRTASKSGQFSQKLTETVSASTPSFESVVAGAKLKESASISANESVGTSTTNTTDLGSSTGITVGRPGTFLTPGKFSYLVQGYIFGDPPKPGAVQKVTPASAEVQTLGVIRSAFTADPRSGGSWWEAGPYNQYVDVALNRPMHIKADPGKGASDPAVTNCLPESSEVAVTEDCVEYFLPDTTPIGLYSSQFYWLRGFFITPADAIGQGPQLLQADAGDVVGLQVRVYNYSLQDMNVGSIKVDFYAQEWDTQCHAPAGYYNHDQNCAQSGGGVVPCADSCDPCCIANATLDSIWIGQDQLQPLPGFNSPDFPGVPNWELASTTFDTGDPSLCGDEGCGDKDYLFWVVVWPELSDNQGQPALRVELPDHSLTRIPPQLKSITDICPIDNDCINGTCRATRTSCVADTDCETAADNVCRGGTCAVSGVDCMVDSDCGECLCEICMGEFSNNVGFYHQPIAIIGEATEVTAAVSSSVRGGAAGALQGDLATERISVTPAIARVGDRVIVRAGLRAIGGRVDGQLVRFYAVPPDAGELTVEEVFDEIETFDHEILARIRDGRIHEAQAPYFPTQLGKHQILISGFVDGEERLFGTAELEVVETLPPTPTVEVPTPTPTIDVSGVNDDGCAISDTAGRSSNGICFLLIVPLAFGLLRVRRR